jgi:tRNA/tmRNA/rRNA uracil-C5-methylase (TrmA/RlmC/RlmD family)
MLAPALKICLICLLFLFTTSRFYAQNNQTQTSLKVRQLIEKKAEYHRLTGGMQDGYRIKIHFDVDRDKAKATHAKFSARFPEYVVDEEYQLPYWVVMVGAFKTKLQAFEAYKKIQSEFPAFIIKAKIKAQ